MVLVIIQNIHILFKSQAKLTNHHILSKLIIRFLSFVCQIKQLTRIMKQNLTIFICLLISLYIPSSLANQTKVLFAFVGETEHSAYSGVIQGLTEANLQGQFLGQSYEIRNFARLSDLPKKLDAYSAILSALKVDDLLSLRGIAPQHPVFNLIAEDDNLRKVCYDNLLSVIPSKKMKQDALLQWRSKHPGTEARAVAWHHAFNKFAARDLNKRFRKAFGKAMNDYSWAGWAAMRMTADTVAREKITNSVEMLHHLQTNLSFDGQKGLDMDFRETGQLRQLILIIENDKPVAEAPVRGVSKDIDSLGFSECSK